MNVLPVIERELRAEARHGMTYVLRLIGAGALLLILAFSVDPNAPAALQGLLLYSQLHAAMLAAIWLWVPLLTADCISRERREGTLGLLFLTSLKAGDVVIAKSLAHGLRALTLWLAAMPVLMIPILVGGINGQQALISVGILASSFLLSLAAGLLASAGSKQWHRALIVALLLAGLFFVMMAYLHGFNLLQLRSFRLARFFYYQSDAVLGSGLSTLWQPTMLVSAILTRASPAFQSQWWAGFCALNALSCLLFLLVCWLCARHVRRHWQELPSSPVQTWFERTFCTPFLLRNWLRMGMRWYLRRNPIGWLELRQWSGRLVSWAWLAVLISMPSVVLSTQYVFLRNDLSTMLQLMAWVLVTSAGFSAAGSFRRERETRVLELLLLTPLGVDEIIRGRLQALLVQFLPSFLLLTAVWYYLQRALSQPLSWAFPVLYWIAFLTIIVNGLYCSVRFRNYAAAVSATLSCWLGPVLIGKVMGGPEYGLPSALLQLTLCGLLAWRLYERLASRGEALLS